MPSIVFKGSELGDNTGKIPADVQSSNSLSSLSVGHIVEGLCPTSFGVCRTSSTATRVTLFLNLVKMYILLYFCPKLKSISVHEKAMSPGLS